jgi:hypothetical protein
MVYPSKIVGFDSYVCLLDGILCQWRNFGANIFQKLIIQVTKVGSHKQVLLDRELSNGDTPVSWGPLGPALFEAVEVLELWGDGLHLHSVTKSDCSLLRLRPSQCHELGLPIEQVLQRGILQSCPCCKALILPYTHPRRRKFKQKSQK